jgi:hypothetical protein
MAHAPPSEYGTIRIVRDFCSSDLKKSGHPSIPPLHHYSRGSLYLLSVDAQCSHLKRETCSVPKQGTSFVWEATY